MKKLILFFFVSIAFFNAVLCQNIGINQPNPDNSALLDMTSTERGLLIPRVDLDDATTAAPVTSPVAEGLLIYNETGTEPHGFYFWNGTKWVMVGSNGYITAFSWTDATDLLRITEAGTNWDVTIDNEADDVTLADVQAACTDDFHNIGGTDAVNDADNVVGNEYNTSMGWDDGTNTVSVTDGGGTKSVVLTGFDNYNNWKLQANGGATTNITSGATVNFAQGGATTVSRAGNTITISSSTWYVPSDVKRTTATHDGNFGGYSSMKAWIQSNGCAGYHVCDANELIRWEQDGGTVSAGWYNTGEPANDKTCGKWNTNSSFLDGPVWFGTFSGCDVTQYVCCCK